MDATQPGLFDLPAGDPPGTAKRPPRGRNREIWARTAQAEVSIVDPAALHEAALQAAEGAVTIELDDGPGVEVAEDIEALDAELDNPTDAIEALGWLIWPISGMEGPLEAGAFRILSMESDVVAESPATATVTWTVKVKLTDVGALRRLAAQGHPERAAEISDNLTVAFQCVADPFAPLATIPGISWRPGQVTVEHLRARAAGDS